MHNVEYRIFKKDVNRGRAQKELDDYVSHATWQEGGHGLSQNIRWYENKVYGSEDEAKDAIEKLDRGWYDQLAVLYEHCSNPKDAKVIEMQNKRAKLFTDYLEKDRCLYAKTLKSNLIGCKHCGSKLAKDYLIHNYCPVCKAEMRPDHVLKSIEAAKNRFQRMDNQINEYIRKKGKKDVRWLVKIEYHT